MGLSTERRRMTIEMAAAVAIALTTMVAADDSLGPVAVTALLTLCALAVPALVHVLVRRRHHRRRRLRAAAAQTLAAAAALALVVPAISYVQSVTARSNSSLAVRSVEWLRDNGGAWLVADVEDAYYSLTAPSPGGPALTRLPSLGVSPAASSPAHPHVVARPAFRPHDVRPLVHPRIAGEGVWRPTQRRFAHRQAAPPVLVTTYRPSPTYPRIVAGLAWIDPRRARLALYPGLKEPPATGASRLAEVPPQSRSRLLATFNSGFKHSDGNGGFYVHGSQLEPMQDGLGTIVGMANGRVDVRSWSGGPQVGRGVVFARQNLPLIVDGGRPNPNLGNGPQWGATVGRAIQVWRSGVGVDRRGDLIYAAADYQTADSLARILIHAGAVRAVELDINSYWVSFITYAKRGATRPQQLLPDMIRPATRYLTPDDRDFFAVYAR